MLNSLQTSYLKENKFLNTLLHGVTVSKLLFLGGLAAVFGGLLTSSWLTAHRLLFAPRTAQPRHCAPIGRLRDS